MCETITTLSGKELTCNYDEHTYQHCPLSNTKGKRLLFKTVTSQIYPKYWPKVKARKYFYCPDPSCEIIYFSADGRVGVLQGEIRAPVMHKLPINTPGRPACYCMGVLESEILEELLVKQCCDSLQDIQDYTSANKGKDCAVTNPTGRCCGSELKQIIDWAKEHREDINSVTVEEATSCCVSIEENTIAMEEIEDLTFSRSGLLDQEL